MVKQSAGLDETFAALADPTRRQILVALGQGDHSVSELAAPFDISLPAISKHLSVLERAGLITREREGRVRRCHLEPEPLSDALEWIAEYGRFWEQSFDSLERLLAQQSKQSKRGR
ncbi:MAG: ArsR/SmtB family transcription factor [Solirubrobacterales bacterium]